MAFLLLLILVPFLAGMILISGITALIIAGSLILIAINLIFSVIIVAIRFWHLVIAVMLIMLFPMLYLEGLLLWLLMPIILMVMLGIFSLINEQKAEIPQAKKTLPTKR
ncbi:hypothetical protein ACLSZP_05510 [Avibacterium avium]|uniref:hypothetical protein n=1 Tax=Avibacterium avium TaxID=751 RepID=UPI003BF8443C